jgi:S-adenosylmethionine:tRNA ribosyltransferase-isomerase
VINTSGTLNAALLASRPEGSVVELHLSTRLPADLWVVELRQPDPAGSQPFYEACAGERLALPGGAVAHLLTPYRPDQREEALAGPGGSSGHVRLWIASLRLPGQVDRYLAEYGFPIRYKYVREGWPLAYYQTVYAGEMGSAEMPSAGRAFSRPLLRRLEKQDVKIVSLVLHTGVASLETHEPPYEEYYRVPAQTARAVNEAQAAGRRVVAVGTTVVRALETVSEEGEGVHPGEGWTRLVITPRRGLRAVNGLLTGLHEPRSTHLAMLEALAGRAPLQRAYAEALRNSYLWHEFGDLHLILP